MRVPGRSSGVLSPRCHTNVTSAADEFVGRHGYRSLSYAGRSECCWGLRLDREGNSIRATTELRDEVIVSRGGDKENKGQY